MITVIVWRFLSRSGASLAGTPHKKNKQRRMTIRTSTCKQFRAKFKLYPGENEAEIKDLKTGDVYRWSLSIPPLKHSIVMFSNNRDENGRNDRMCEIRIARLTSDAKDAKAFWIKKIYFRTIKDTAA